MYYFSFLFDFQQQTSLLMKAHLNYKNCERFVIFMNKGFNLTLKRWTGVVDAYTWRDFQIVTVTTTIFLTQTI